MNDDIASVFVPLKLKKLPYSMGKSPAYQIFQNKSLEIMGKCKMLCFIGSVSKLSYLMRTH